MKAWADSKDLKGYHSEIIDRKDGDAQIPPLLLITIDATNGSEDTALLYGHCDKQPPLTDQWTVAGPFDPQIIDDKYAPIRSRSHNQACSS
jgi:acetylornithine deacetylase/succinyl-diaminopimelate desuccinylase-like protein